jgi:hypothetical protein
MTIDELMKDRVPGTVHMTCNAIGLDDFFVPYFKGEDGYWRGLDKAGEYSWICPETAKEDWSIYKDQS